MYSLGYFSVSDLNGSTKIPLASSRAASGVAIPSNQRHRQALQIPNRSEEHTSELQSQSNLVCRLLLEKKKKIRTYTVNSHSNNGKTQHKMATSTRHTPLTFFYISIQSSFHNHHTLLYSRRT